MTTYPPGATFCRTCGYCLHGLPENRCPECGNPFDPADPKTFLPRPPRRVLRRVVWAAVLVVVVVLPFAGGWTYFWWGWRQEQPAIAALTAQGVTITSAPVGPRWLRVCTPLQLAFVFERADSATAPVPFVSTMPYWDTRDYSVDLARLQHLRVVDVALEEHSCEAAVGRLSRLQSLEELRLWGVVLSDDAVARLAEIPNLRKLDLFAIASPRALAAFRERRPGVLCSYFEGSITEGIANMHIEILQGNTVLPASRP